MGSKQKFLKNTIISDTIKSMKKKKYISEIPELMKEWDWEANAGLDPSKIAAGSNKKAYWVCKKCGYKWTAKINNRAILGRGCPCCANKVVVLGKNDLATTHPDLAKEWHPTKNGNLAPEKVTYGCGKKIWWICPKGHEYQATINHRTGNKGTNCPICNSGRQTSFSEQSFYFYIKKLYPDAINRYKADFLGNMELDIYIPSIKWAIEYDGEAFHKKDKLKREQKKYHLCQKHGIKLIRFREKEIGLGEDICDESYHTSDMSNPKNLEKMIIHFLHKLDFSGKYSFQINSFNVNVKRDRIKILKSYSTEYKKDSFGELYPEIAREWHLTKNEGLTPYMFKAGSDHKVWWLCPKCGCEYKASISHRTNPKNKERATGCPKCGIEKSSQAKRKAINMIDPKTNKIIQTFISIADASRKMKISHGNIGMVCQGIRPKAGGYIWRYANEQEVKKYQKPKKQLEFDFK